MHNNNYCCNEVVLRRREVLTHSLKEGLPEVAKGSNERGQPQ